MKPYLIPMVLVALSVCPALLALEVSPAGEAVTAPTSALGASTTTQIQDGLLAETNRELINLGKSDEMQGCGIGHLEIPRTGVGMAVEPNG